VEIHPAPLYHMVIFYFPSAQVWYNKALCGLVPAGVHDC
jgi:hypothetical protein